MDDEDEEPSSWEWGRRRRQQQQQSMGYTTPPPPPPSSGPGFPAAAEPAPAAAPSRSLETLEVVLQKVLRSLCALADNLDRIASSLEAEGDHWRFIHKIGNGLWTGLNRVKLVTDDGKRPTWVCSILLLLVCYMLLLGLGTSFGRPKLVLEAQEMPLPAKRVQLPDGRTIAYLEQGVSQEQARHSILVVHGFLSSRLAGIPGVNNSLLEEFGVRLVSYDLPGFGESDPHHSRAFNTSANDMEMLADELGLGDRFWLVAHGGGGPHAWAAIRYIPDRLAGVAMISPAGNPYDGHLTYQEAEDAWRVWSYRRKLLHFVAKRLSSVLDAFIRRTLLNKLSRITRSLYATVRIKDQVLFENGEFMCLFQKNLRESMKQQSVVPLAQELLLLVNDWGFDLGDLRLRRQAAEGLLGRLRILFSGHGDAAAADMHGFKQPIHVWQGTDDVLVPAVMADFAKRRLPQVHLHKLHGEGHFSWFYFCHECHRILLETMLGMAEGPRRPAKEDQIILQVVHGHQCLNYDY